MKNNLTSLGMLFTGLFSSSAFAHAGHDHSHWLSSPIHTLFITCGLSVVVAALLLVKQQNSAKDSATVNPKGDE